MPTAISIEQRQLAVALEGTRGTVPASPTKFFSLTKDSDINSALKLLSDPALRGYNSRGASFPGPISSKGPFKTPVRASDIYYWLKMALGAPASTEVASFTVTTGVNDTIDFIVTATQYHATLAAGTFAAGLNSGTDANTTLCYKIVAALNAAEAGTYTCTFAPSTGLFTITKSTGTFSLLWNSGTNTAKSLGPLIGFPTSADSTGADTYVASVAVNPPYSHVFTQGQYIQLPSAAFYIYRALTATSSYTVKQYPIGSVEKLKISSTNEGPLEMDATVVAQTEADYTGAWSPTYAAESGVLMFNQTTVKIAGATPSVPYTKNWSLELDPGLKEFRPLSTFQYPQDILAAGPFMAKGDAEFYFMSDTERLKFIADTLTSLEFKTVGAIINAAGGATVKNSLDLLLSNVEYEAYPYGEADGFLAAKAKFNAPSVGGSAVVVATLTCTVVPGA